MRRLIVVLPLLALAAAGGPSAAAADQPTVTLKGQRSALVSRSHAVGAVPSSQAVSVAVTLKPRNEALLEQLAAQRSGRAPLSAAQAGALFGPTPTARRAVARHLQAAGMRVQRWTGPTVWVSGTADDAEQAFGTDLERYEAPGGRTFQAPATAVRLPDDVAGAVQSISGLDTSAVYTPSASIVKPAAAVSPVSGCNKPGQIKSMFGGMLPADLAASNAYNYQSLLDGGADGDGEAVSFLEYSSYAKSDVDKFKDCFNLTTPVGNVAVNGGTTTLSANDEVTLDVETTLAAAPGLDHAWVYKAPNGRTALSTVINAMVADAPAKNVHIISISWGLCERYTLPGELRAQQNALARAAVQGISVFVASGDSGSNGCGSASPFLDTDATASSPFATGIGGTHLTPGSGTKERVWKGGGGGISGVWPKPAWQPVVADSDGAACGAAPGFCRQVPDISLDADPNTGYIIYCTAGPCHNGGWGQIGGTSAGAPLMAGITADMNEYSLANGGQRLGFANPFLYGAPAGHFYDVTLGDNDDSGTLGAYSARVGYDMASGLGSVDAAALAADLAAFTATPPAAVETSTTAVQDKGKIVVGQTVNLHGTAKESDGTLLPAESVVWLEFRFAGSPYIYYSKNIPLGGSGAWAATRKPAKRMQWRAHYMGDDGHAGSTSAWHYVYVTPKLSVASSRSTVSHLSTFTLSGHSTPNMSGAKVTAQWRGVNGRIWHSIGSVTVGRLGGYSRTVRLAAGTKVLRWHYAGGTTSRWLSADSTGKVVRVT
jgi:kumamolisin